MGLARSIAMRTIGLSPGDQVMSIRRSVDEIRAHYRESFRGQPDELRHSMRYADQIERAALEALEAMASG